MGSWLSVVGPRLFAFSALLKLGFGGGDYGAPEAEYHLADLNHLLGKRLPGVLPQVALVSQELETVVGLHSQT